MQKFVKFFADHFLKLCDFPDAFYTTLPSAIYHLLREIIFMKPSIDFSQKQIFVIRTL